MTAGVSGQDIYIQTIKLGGDAYARVGFRNNSGTREVYCFVNSTANTTTTLSAPLPDDDLPHVARLDFAGATYTLYLDDVSVGSNSPAVASIDAVDWVSLNMNAVNLDSNISISRVEITDCAGEPFDIGWLTAATDSSSTAVASNSGSSAFP